ncbi:MAG: MtaA/CmuA family methyltransferase [Bryobacterales bacterium]|nr:MtaA/CmuA family methyltransferase [Bryobacterales bacterium]
MTVRERVLAVLRGERLRPVPVGSPVQTATLARMEASGASWPEAHSDARQMAELAAAAHTRFGFELVHVPFDQTIEAELLGARVDYGTANSNCSIRSHPFSLDDEPPACRDFASGRGGVVLEAIARLKRTCPAALAGGVVGPFTLACALAGPQQVLMDSIRRPARVERWLDFAVEAGREYARLQVAAGADAITVEDMSAGLDLTSPRVYERLILPAQRRLIEAVPAPVILHICGSNTRILELLARTGAAALSLESRTDLRAAAALGGCAIMGGVATVEVLLRGTVEDVRRASRECLAAGVHLLAPGCGVPPAAPDANLQEMADAARQWDQ